MEEKKEYQRINAFIEVEDYKKLRVKLIMQNKNFTEWLNEKIKEEIASE